MSPTRFSTPGQAHDGAKTHYGNFLVRSTDADRERFRKFRHALPETVLANGGAARPHEARSDFAVPVDRDREMIRYYRKRLADEYPGRYVIFFGHVGTDITTSTCCRRSERI